jgi:hypothetical protein
LLFPSSTLLYPTFPNRYPNTKANYDRQVPGDTEHAGTHFNAVRVCFAWEEEEMLDEGIERLARVIRTLLKEQMGGEKIGEKATREGVKDFW